MVPSDTPDASPAAAPTADRRLPFTRMYPDDADLWQLVGAYERGDYQAVREGAPRLAERTPSAEVRNAALDLRRRIEPDRMQIHLLLLTFALLAFLTSWFYHHKH